VETKSYYPPRHTLHKKESASIFFPLEKEKGKEENPCHQRIVICRGSLEVARRLTVRGKFLAAFFPKGRERGKKGEKKNQYPLSSSGDAVYLSWRDKGRCLQLMRGEEGGKEEKEDPGIHRVGKKQRTLLPPTKQQGKKGANFELNVKGGRKEGRKRGGEPLFVEHRGDGFISVIRMSTQKKNCGFRKGKGKKRGTAHPESSKKKSGQAELSIQQ